MYVCMNLCRDNLKQLLVDATICMQKEDVPLDILEGRIAVRAYIHTYIHTVHTHKYIYMYIRTYIQTYIHIQYIYTNIYTYIKHA